MLRNTLIAVLLLVIPTTIGAQSLDRYPPGTPVPVPRGQNESGTLPVRLTRIHLGEVAREAARRHGPAAAKKEQRVEIGGEAAATWIEADAALLAQVHVRARKVL